MRSLVPGEDGSTSLVPHMLGDAVGRDSDAGEQNLTLLVEVDGDIDQLTRRHLVRTLAGVDPLEVRNRQGGREALAQLHRGRVLIILSAFHTHVAQDKALRIRLNLLGSQIELKLQLQLLERPLVHLSNVLTSSSQVGFWVKQSAEPEPGFAEVASSLQTSELTQPADKIVHPGGGSDLGNLIDVPLTRNDLRADALRNLPEHVSSLTSTGAHLLQVLEVSTHCLKESRSHSDLTL